MTGLPFNLVPPLPTRRTNSNLFEGIHRVESKGYLWPAVAGQRMGLRLCGGVQWVVNGRVVAEGAVTGEGPGVFIRNR